MNSINQLLHIKKQSGAEQLKVDAKNMAQAHLESFKQVILEYVYYESIFRNTNYPSDDNCWIEIHELIIKFYLQKSRYNIDAHTYKSKVESFNKNIIKLYDEFGIDVTHLKFPFDNPTEIKHTIDSILFNKLHITKNQRKLFWEKVFYDKKTPSTVQVQEYTRDMTEFKQSLEISMKNWKSIFNS